MCRSFTALTDAVLCSFNIWTVHTAEVSEGLFFECNDRLLYRLVSSVTGYRLWNADLRTDDNPLEAGMDFVCRDEGDYVGKDAVDLIKQKGLKKKLAFFQLQE